jgi:hypothetical protein
LIFYVPGHSFVLLDKIFSEAGKSIEPSFNIIQLMEDIDIFGEYGIVVKLGEDIVQCIQARRKRDLS